ncbi:MAG: nucleoside triphosphate pyrophosphatase [Methylomicrobium sp.]
MSAQIVLASASPRRQELLRQIGVTFKVVPVDIDETPLPNENPLAYVERIAAEKSAVAVERIDCGLPVLSADTAVILDGRIMGKPKDKADALAMLEHLSGRTHQVLSAISLRGSAHWQAVSSTEVTFRQISEAEREAYWLSGEPADKAGAYAIQGLGSVFVESITGSFSGVVGLPLFETAELLAKQGITVFP